MGPKARVTERDFFRQPLLEQIDLKHPLVRLAGLIDWEQLGTPMSESFVSSAGRPATSPRLIAGLLYLQHAFDLSDEDVVTQWFENPQLAGLHWRDVSANRAADRSFEPDTLAQAPG